LGQDTKTESNLLKSRESGKTLVILIASDKGLCGGYNAMLYRELVKMSKETEVVAIGSYAKKITLRAGLSLLESFVGVSENVSDFEITEITQFILDKFRATDEYKDVFVLFGHILRGVSYESDLQKILPLSVFHSDILEKDLEEYTCEPSKAHIIETLIPGLIQSLLLQHMREARAAEHTARMVAMKSATDSATEYYNKLKLSFNRARQSGITAEIAEIVAGANALSE
jgi:F-type H+-transporting ATPase subunit gamma